jgi:hypothetical protein
MQDVPVDNLLESFKAQLSSFIQQRDQAQINFQQLQGAIFACEHVIKQYETNLLSSDNKQSEKIEGDNNVEIDNESSKQIA